jgi:hypothetical protein
VRLPEAVLRSKGWVVNDPVYFLRGERGGWELVREEVAVARELPASQEGGA